MIAKEVRRRESKIICKNNANEQRREGNTENSNKQPMYERGTPFNQRGKLSRHNSIDVGRTNPKK